MGKKMKMILELFFLTFLIAVFSVNIGAIDTEFELKMVEENEIQARIKNYNFQSIKEEKMHIPFSCYAVNEFGDYALGFKDSTTSEGKVLVFDSKGDFLYGISFETPSTFQLDLDEKNIVIYSVRGDVAICLNSDGNCIEMGDIVTNSETRKCWSRLSKSQTVIDDTTYTSNLVLFNLRLKSSSFSSQLVKTDANGNETILFDNSDSSNRIIIGFVIVVILIVGISIFSLIYFLTKVNKKSKHSFTKTQ